MTMGNNSGAVRGAALAGLGRALEAFTDGGLACPPLASTLIADTLSARLDTSTADFAAARTIADARCQLSLLEASLSDDGEGMGAMPATTTVLQLRALAGALRSYRSLGAPISEIALDAVREMLDRVVSDVRAPAAREFVANLPAPTNASEALVATEVAAAVATRFGRPSVQEW